MKINNCKLASKYEHDKLNILYLLLSYNNLVIILCESRLNQWLAVLVLHQVYAFCSMLQGERNI